MNKKISQAKNVMKHLQEHGSITAREAIERFGVMRLAAIIFILRHDYGMPITMQFEHGKNRYGDKVRWGRYYLGK